ncbi:multidrug DMT transporter permease [Leucobacter sp. UT-8R-CII-1-4]|uniref:multidrug DMT transporter permease n=1 Tax=Leucobacter sp. UT-8R-CII-1-4 TaxID=3040075 RepID=UPI0024A91067|nr:multidrug DMT transporter permease [Leucobacter sp. UT-8R-CII-1-4]MDI6022650.1 multidrug DMT transporter permease [Leucobacter sp. UT-8R-CII-1-4]
MTSTLIGISLAVFSAAFLSLGNIWQSRGVQIATAHRQGRSQFGALLRTKIWLFGTVMFGVAIVLQMSSLAFAPITLVQPIGILALVFSVLINAKHSGVRPSQGVVKSVTVTLLGVTAYVIIASVVTTQGKISDQQLINILCALAAALLIAGVIRLLNQGKSLGIPVLYVVLAGMFSAFVATLGKTVISRVKTLVESGLFSFDSGTVLTIICVLGMGIASALTIYFTQTAYTCNPSDVVVAGLTVIDPGIAVFLGILILNEAAGASWWSLLAILLAGVVAMFGVVRLVFAEQNSLGADKSGNDQGSAATPADAHTPKS